MDARQQRALSELVAHLGQDDDERALQPRVLSPIEDLPLVLLRAHHLAPLAFHAGYTELRNDYLRCVLRAEIRGKMVADAVAALTAAGLPVILLKGVSYVGVIYDDPGERPMNDIDLMVRPDDHARAIDVLGELGWAPSTKRSERSRTHHATTLVFRDIALDLHRSMIQPLRSRIDVHDLWLRALPAIERDDEALRLDPVDEAVLHLVHIGRHELMVSAVAYVDARRLLRRRGVTRDRVLERAASFRLRRATLAALAMTDAFARATLDVDWPARAMGILPGPAEVLTAAEVPRARQIARKATLVDGPRELMGLLAVGALARIRR